MNARTKANNYALPGDPDLFGDAYTAGIKQYGDNGSNCCLCGKRTGNAAKTALVLSSIMATAIPLAEVAELDGFDEGADTLGCFPIGRECRKRLPAAFVIPSESETK